MKPLPRLIAAILATLLPQAALAHGLEWRRIAQDAAIALQFGYGTDDPAAFAAVTLTAPGTARPFQTGRTDGNGRFAFLPDRAGAWQVTVDDGDGHRLDFTLPVAAASAAGPAARWPGGETLLRLALAVSLLGNLVLLLWLRWRPGRG